MSFTYFDVDEKTGEIIIGEMERLYSPVTNVKRVDKETGFSIFLGNKTDKESDDKNSI